MVIAAYGVQGIRWSLIPAEWTARGGRSKWHGWFWSPLKNEIPLSWICAVVTSIQIDDTTSTNSRGYGHALTIGHAMAHLAWNGAQGRVGGQFGWIGRVCVLNVSAKWLRLSTQLRDRGNPMSWWACTMYLSFFHIGVSCRHSGRFLWNLDDWKHLWKVVPYLIVSYLKTRWFFHTRQKHTTILAVRCWRNLIWIILRCNLHRDFRFVVWVTMNYLMCVMCSQAQVNRDGKGWTRPPKKSSLRNDATWYSFYVSAVYRWAFNFEFTFDYRWIHLHQVDPVNQISKAKSNAIER